MSLREMLATSERLFDPTPKPAKGTALKERRRRTRQRLNQDKAESEKVKERSGGRCEVRTDYRCAHQASEVHHMISGFGKRARGKSLLAEHKQHVCDRCHLDITGDVGGRKLKRVGGVEPLWTDTYERVERDER